MIVSVLISIIGVFGIVACCYFTARAAGKISKDISSTISQKIEDNIRRDIDNGRFFY